MRRTGAIDRIACFLVALVATASCAAKSVHLGGCAEAPVSANEVLWTGDSWILMPGSQVTRVRELAREQETIGPDEEYVNVAAPATTMSAIAEQYNTRQMGATKVKVLLMDGGTWDTITGNGSDASVTAAANAFDQHLAKVASDGTVERIVYFLPPELPGIPGVAALRPHVQQACAQSPVKCYFLDLQPLWEGHPEYSSGGGVFANEMGARVLADAIWAIMQQNCIAQ